MTRQSAPADPASTTWLRVRERCDAIVRTQRVTLEDAEAHAPAPVDRSIPAHLTESRLYFFAAVAGAIALGLFVRSYHVLNADFPLNDGGLFYEMARNFQATDYRMPSFTTYNGGGIPFAYPPLGLFLAGLLDDLTPLALIDVFHYLPLVYSVLTVGAFFLLARSLLSSRVAIVAAVAAFALIPRTFIWLLMGGGITRSLGFMLAILALWQAHRLYVTGDRRHVVPAVLLCAGTVLSHLETGWFLFFSIALFWLTYGRDRRGIENSVLVAAGTILVTSPWWTLILARHGIDTFVAANATGGSIFSGGGITEYVLLSLVRVVSTSEPFFPVIGAMGLLGAFVCVVTRRPLLPVWWVAIIILDVRAFPTFTSAPVALLAGIAFAELIFPVLQHPISALQGAAGGGRSAVVSTDGTSANGHQQPPRRDGQAPARPLLAQLLPAGAGWTSMLAIYVLLSFGTVSALVTQPGLGGEGPSLSALTVDQRETMRWVSEHTPDSSLFLVVPRGPWATDKESEWFPVLAARPSVATVQGTEWLPGNAFNNQVNAFDRAWECGYRTEDCLEEWLTDSSVDFTHIYVPADAGGQCCATLVDSLRASPGYRTLYDGTGGTVFLRTRPAPENRDAEEGAG